MYYSCFIIIVNGGTSFIVNRNNPSKPLKSIMQLELGFAIF